MSGGEGLLGKSADWYAAAGWKVFPCHGIVRGKCTCGKVHSNPKDFGKHPRTRDGQKSATSDRAAVAEWWEDMPDSNVAVQCSGSGFLVVDVDPRNGGLESWDRLEELTSGAMDATVEAWTGQYTTRGGVARGRHLFYRVGEGESLKDKVEGVPGIDIKHKGYVLIAPSQHGSGLTYEWAPGKAPWQKQMAWAPDELLGLLRRKAPGGAGDGETFGTMEWDGEKLDVDALVRDGIYAGERSNTLYKIACSIANEVPPAVLRTERGKMSVRFQVRSINDKACRPPMGWGDRTDDDLKPQCDGAIDFVIKHPKNRGAITNELKAVAEHLSRSSPTPAVSTGKRVPAPGIEKVPVSERVESGWDDDGGDAETKTIDWDLPADLDEPLRPLKPEEEEWGIRYRTMTDVGNGRRLADFYSESTKHTVGLGWFCWDGSFWRPDAGSKEIAERAKRIYSVIMKEAGTYLDTDEDRSRDLAKYAMHCKDNSMINNAVKSACSDPRIDVPLERWDGDDYLLGVQNGVVNLRTGDLISGDPSQYITKRCSVPYTPGLTNIRFEQFLDFITEGDVEFREWLQRAAGLTLSGRRELDVLFLVYGLPGTGKNTLVEALYNLLADYSKTIESDLLLARRQPSSQDMYMYAELLGRRMFWVDELPEAERLKEDKVKRLTGSDNIDGRRPAERPFSFKSKGKLWISTNHRPPIRDDAMWRRIRPIPFTRVPEHDDTSLKPYLHAEDGALPAILSWAVEGAVRYFGAAGGDGLGWCKRVWEAADVYRREEDTITIFLTEETREVTGGELQMKPLYAVYSMWCEDRGERPMSVRPFAQKLLERGEKVLGMGSRAMLQGRMLVPRVVESGTAWDSLVVTARDRHA